MHRVVWEWNEAGNVYLRPSTSLVPSDVETLRAVISGSGECPIGAVSTVLYGAGTDGRTLVANRLCRDVFGTCGVKPGANDVYDVWYAFAWVYRSAIPQDWPDTESGICCNK